MSLRKEVRQAIRSELKNRDLDDLYCRWIFLHKFQYDSNDERILTEEEVEVEKALKHYERLHRFGLLWLVQLFR